MSRPIRTDKIVRYRLLEFIENLYEVFDKLIPTDYKIINYGSYTAMQFKTNSGNSYDLEFHYTTENTNTILNNNQILKQILNTNKDIINVIDIAFTLSDVQNKDNEEEFTIDTNLNEQYEVMGRIAYIAKKQLDKYKKYNVFILADDKQSNRLKMYNKLVTNIFSSMFDIYHGVSEAHKGTSIFLIRKQN